MKRLVLLVTALLMLGGKSSAGARPNVIVVLADDFGYRDVNCYGGSVPTPNLDRMGREGIRFTQFYVASPICSPSRAGLITGQYPARWRITSYLQTRKGSAGCEQTFVAQGFPREISLAKQPIVSGRWSVERKGNQ